MADEGRRLGSARRLAQEALRGGWVVHWPKEYGGRGASRLQQIIYSQELDRAKAPPTIIQGIALLGPTLMQWGTRNRNNATSQNSLRRGNLVPGIVGAQSGSDLAAVETRAIDEGDDFIVNGSKVWTSNAHHADLSSCCAAPTRRAQAQGHQLPAGRHEKPGRDGAPAGADDRREAVSTRSFSKTSSAEGEPGGRQESGLDGRDDQHDVRATIGGGGTDMMVEVRRARRAGQEGSSGAASRLGRQLRAAANRANSRARRRRSSTPAIASSPASSRDCRPAPKAR